MVLRLECCDWPTLVESLLAAVERAYSVEQRQWQKLVGLGVSEALESDWTQFVVEHNIIQRGAALTYLKPRIGLYRMPSANLSLSLPPSVGLGPLAHLKQMQALERPFGWPLRHSP